MRKNIVELNRTFIQIPTDLSLSDATEDSESYIGLRSGEGLTWDKLINENRVVLLAEAGSGKTEEIRQATVRLRNANNPAFFLRLEHIVNSFELSFEEGNYEEFLGWISSDQDGWLFLDSIDEARLKDPRDFEAAIRLLSNKLEAAFQRVHIIITGRVSAWRFRTDLEFCSKHLPFLTQSEAESTNTNALEPNLPGASLCRDIGYVNSDIEVKNKNFSVYSLTDLSSAQIKAFIKGNGVVDADKFLSDIERYDAAAYTTRPQDLEELVEYWHKNNKIGTHLELIEHSVERRLKERDQDRAESESLTYTKTYTGIKLLAAASTLMHQSIIRIPDGAKNNQGIDSKRILNDWSDRECVTLLGRPIFDQAVYGAVRFHHRSVREFLTATWIHDMIRLGGCRKDIEKLLFQKKYGVNVITPTFKPIITWLVLFDKKIRQKAFSIDPEILFQSGDPQRLPLNFRIKILKSVCKKIQMNVSDRNVMDYSAIQKFANNDMADTIVDLLVSKKSNPSTILFLLKMIWHGRIKQALPAVKKIALDVLTEHYSRIASIRALKEIGSNEDFEDLMRVSLAVNGKLSRDIISEIVDHVEPNEKSVIWLFDALERIEDKNEHGWDPLGYSISNFIERLTPELQSKFISISSVFLRREPLIERKFCEISERFSWLIKCSAKAIESLVLSKSPLAFESSCLEILVKIPIFEQYRIFDFNEFFKRMSLLVREWPDLNYHIFWKSIDCARSILDLGKGERITDFWQASIFRGFWAFDLQDFNYLKYEISSRSLLDDRLVALSLAFQLYVQNNRSASWREQLKNLVKDDDDLQNKLSELFNPIISSAQREYNKHQADWRRKERARDLVSERRRKKNLKWLSENHEKLNDFALARKGFVSNAQHYLLEQMNAKANNNSHWTSGNWYALIPEYGSQIANSFKEGLLNYWREYRPILRSEKDNGSDTPIAVIMGLSGLAIESAEHINWPDNLNAFDAELACRYAICELNGFPNWFSKLSEKYQAVISKCLLVEVQWELEVQKAEREKNYVLSKLAWAGHWLWNDMAPPLFELLNIEPIDFASLSYLLQIVQKSTTISDDQLTKLAQKKCGMSSDPEQLACWFSVWIGVEPVIAIDSLSNHLHKISDSEEAKIFAMMVIVNLMGGGHVKFSVRDNFKAPVHLKNLYLLMHKYIKRCEDIDRVGRGVFSPGLQDDAQHARDGLFSLLKDIPGQETYSALIELSKKHPVESFRSWMKLQAKQRAEVDGDIKPWTDLDFSVFVKSYLPSGSHNMQNNPPIWEKVAGFIFGTLFVGILLYVAILIPDPTTSQYATFRTILALAGAAVAGILTGFIHIDGKNSGFKIRAGGALAVFVIIYLVTPKIL